MKILFTIGIVMTVLGFISSAVGAFPLADVSASSTVTEETPKGAPFNVGQMYDQFGRGIQGEASSYPDFDTAVELHVLLDAIRQSSDEGREVALGAG